MAFKKTFLITALLFFFIRHMTMAQLQPMKWFHAPAQWTGHPSDKLTFTVDSHTDYWQVTHYGFKRDNGPYYYQEISGNFEASVKITGQYKELFHQAGLMIRIDEKNWIKTGIEYVDGVQNVSAVVTREVSDWSVVPRQDSPPAVWLKLLRKGDYVEIRYSFDNVKFDMLRLAYFPPDVKVQIGVVAAAPGEQSFAVVAEEFKILVIK
jgi:regulation of enolase protein 1 (concanavalin A-like superfamily)